MGRTFGASRSAMMRLTNMMTKNTAVNTSAGTTLAARSSRQVEPCPSESNHKKSV